MGKGRPRNYSSALARWVAACHNGRITTAFRRSATECPTIPVTVRGDYICPWCYVGEARLKALSNEFDLRITHKSFLLRPDLPDEGIEHQARPGETPGELSGHLKAQALDADLTHMRRPRRTPNTLKALQVTVHARQQGKGAEVHDELFRVYWDEGEDVGQPEVIRKVLESQGIFWGPVEAALNENAYLDTVLGEYQEALDIGFEGVPAFVFGNLGFTGAQPMHVFRAVAQRARDALVADPGAFEPKP
ncbi:MAG: DsbA family oxidoreductase [SAR202 cluster bacterium]|nr:DsbA family oxidoreductase [SAR202 cluster bacterium]